MKAFPTSFAALLLTALSATTAPVLAQSTAAISLTQASPSSLRLRIVNATPLTGRVQVVRLSTGQMLFSDTFEAPAYGHRFDFNRAPSGRYLVRAQSGATLHRCMVRVYTQAQGSAVCVVKLTSRPAVPSVAVRHLASASTGTPAISAVEVPLSQSLSQEL